MICLQGSDASGTKYKSVCAGSDPFISQLSAVIRISDEAGPGYKLNHTQYRDAAMTPAGSASSAVVVGKRPDWSLVIQGRHIAFGENKVMVDGFLHV